jgi:hypothetical protein
LKRVVVVLHERLGEWSRQLRPRLGNPVIRWFETRTGTDLERVLAGGVGSPVVLVDLDRQRESGWDDLIMVTRRASDARVLVIDRNGDDAAKMAARELGATCVLTGFVPPPVVASLLKDWVDLAAAEIDRSGWNRSEFPETVTDPWSWLREYVGDCFVAEATAPEKPASVWTDEELELEPLDAEGSDLRDC